MSRQGQKGNLSQVDQRALKGTVPQSNPGDGRLVGPKRKQRGAKGARSSTTATTTSKRKKTARVTR